MFKANLSRKSIPTAQIAFYICSMSLKDILERVKSDIKDFGEDAVVDWHSYPYDDGRYLYIFKNIPETDEAMESRIAQEKEWEQKHQEAARKQWEALNKVFGSK